MKIIKSTLISLLFVPLFVLAQNQAVLPNAGLTPESPFYFIDKLSEALRGFFTFNPENKARLQITFAAERVAEIKVILETKGVEAKGLEVAQSRLQEHLGNAAEIVVKQKGKGKDVSKLAKELDDILETPKSALADSFKAEKRTLETKEDELKAQLKSAHRTGDTAKEEAVAQELGKIKAQKELLELKEEDIEDELEAEEEKLEEEMEAKEEAEKAIKEAEQEKQEIIDEAAEEGVELPADAFAEFDGLLTQAKNALQAGNFVEAKNFAKRAGKSLERLENTIEELEEVKEKDEELKEEKEQEAKEEQAGIIDPKTRVKLNSLIPSAVVNQQPQKKGFLISPETKSVPELKKAEKQQPAISLADQFVALEKELLGVKASGSFLAPAHYERIKQDLVVLENKRYSANEVGRLRDLALKLAPHLQDQKKTPESVIATPPPASPPPAPPLESQPVLKNLGVRFEPWDKNTNRAGAFIFLPAENKLFLEYGVEVASAEGGTKILPTFEYRTASDADVLAAMDGVVTNVTYKEGTQDYSIHIQPALNSPWVLEHDHVSSLRIAKGDAVKAGDILGKAGTLGGNLGRTEIMFWNSSGSRPTTYCPFKYFDPQLLSEYQQKVLRHMKDWEEFKGNQNLYSEEKHIFPGCVYETLLD